MIPIVCIDNSGGMLFNKRRQSRDEEIIKKVMELSRGSVLKMNGYSAEMFEKYGFSDMQISENFLAEAEKDEFVFVEDKELKPYSEKIEKLVVFLWNRDYPSDFKLDIERADFELETGMDFKGSSHDKITLEVYAK